MNGLIPEGKYDAKVVGFGDTVNQTITNSNFILRVYIKIEKYDEAIIHLFGSLSMITLMIDNKDHFIGQIWKVVVTHKQIQDRMYMNLERRRS